jgi:RimJ/RimL family protein N-acetyltransferase
VVAATISAGRLTLRPFTPDDVDWVYEVSQDPLLRQFVQVPTPYQREDAEFFVREIAIGGWATRKRAEFLVADAAAGTRLGRVGLALGPPGLAEIGYWADPRARGRGVVTDAARVLCRWGFRDLDLHLIQWRAEVGNVASRRVAEKAGFTIEATLRQRLHHRGTWVDSWVGSLLPNEVR